MSSWARESFTHLTLDNGRYDGRRNDGVISDGFDIAESDLGVTGQVLFWVIDESKDPIGYIIVPVTIPATIT
jgi:hypothetical protein